MEVVEGGSGSYWMRSVTDGYSLIGYGGSVNGKNNLTAKKLD